MVERVESLFFVVERVESLFFVVERVTGSLGDVESLSDDWGGRRGRGKREEGRLSCFVFI